MEIKDAAIVQLVLSYFLRYPKAADTLAGIVDWRLREEIAHRMVEETKSAVTWLLSEGYLVREPSMPPVYRLNPAMRDKAAELLNERR